ncbi:MAG: hypothetical protein RL264_540 [Bacteroidota bacterium]
MSVEFFIANRLIRKNGQGTNVSKPIIRISIISITLAIVVNLVTVAIVTGFQNEIRSKVSGFNAPLLITKKGFSSVFEALPFHKQDPLSEEIKSIEGVTNAQYVAYKPALLQSQKFDNTIKIKGKNEVVKNQQEISGVLFKGVSTNYDWTFIKKHLKEGRIPKNTKNYLQEIIVSESISTLLHFNLNDTVVAFFVKNQPVKRQYRVVGIYDTGLEEYDRKMVFCPLEEVQKLNDYGASIDIFVADTLAQNGALVVRTTSTGNDEDTYFDWGNGLSTYTGCYLHTLQDTLLKVNMLQADVYGGSKKIASAELAIKCPKNLPYVKSTDLSRDEEGNLKIQFLTNGNAELTTRSGDKVVISTKNTFSTTNEFVGAIEVQLSDWRNTKAMQQKLEDICEMRPTKEGDLLEVINIEESEPDLFVWLSFLDYNVYIIILLMLVIGIINIGSALLVLIVMRTNFIGIFKALGASNWSIRKIFILQAAHLIVRGMLIGNAIGLGLCFVQWYFEPFTLDPKVYFLDKVPVELTIIGWALVNLITFLVCVISLLLPSWFVTRIAPVKAIRFN